MADRIGVINKGEIILVEDKAGLMLKLGKKQLTLHLQRNIDKIPPELAPYNLELSDGGSTLTYTYDTKGERTGITSVLSDLRGAGIRFYDLDTSQSSLEDIFVSLVDGAMNFPCGRRNLQVRNGAHLAHAAAKASSRPWFRPRSISWCSEPRDRLPHHPGRRRQLRHLHRAGARDAVGTHTEHRQWPRSASIFQNSSARSTSCCPRRFPIRDRARYVGAAATKSIVLGLIILATAGLFVPLKIHHPFWMLDLPGADGGDLQPVRLHHRHLGRRFSRSCR